MATPTIPTRTSAAKGPTGTAYFAGANAIELLELDAERISETAFALSTAEAYDSGAQAAFYALGQLAERLQRRAKEEGDRLATLSTQHGETAQ